MPLAGSVLAESFAGGEAKAKEVESVHAELNLQTMDVIRHHGWRAWSREQGGLREPEWIAAAPGGRRACSAGHSHARHDSLDMARRRSSTPATAQAVYMADKNSSGLQRTKPA